MSHLCIVMLVLSYTLQHCSSEALQTFLPLKHAFHVLHFGWILYLFPSHLMRFYFPELLSCDGFICPVPAAVITSHAASGPSSLRNVVLGTRVPGVCCPNSAASDTTVHVRCLKNSASQLSCALRKYFLGFKEQQSEMRNIMKEVCGAAGK